MYLVFCNKWFLRNVISTVILQQTDEDICNIPILIANMTKEVTKRLSVFLDKFFENVLILFSKSIAERVAIFPLTSDVNITRFKW